VGPTFRVVFIIIIGFGAKDSKILFLRFEVADFFIISLREGKHDFIHTIL